MSASALSHEWCEVSLKIDRATSRDHVEEGCKRTQYKTYWRHIPQTVYATHHNTQTSTARAGALLFHHPAWVEHHTGGSRSTPTVHPC